MPAAATPPSMLAIPVALAACATPVPLSLQSAASLAAYAATAAAAAAAGRELGRGQTRPEGRGASPRVRRGGQHGEVKGRACSQHK